MAQTFNLTAQLNLRGPANVKQISAQIRRDLGNLNVDIKFKIDPGATRNVAALKGSLKQLNATFATTVKSANQAADAIRQFGRSAASVNIKNIPQQIAATNTAVVKLQRSSQNAATSINTVQTEMQEFGRQSALAVRRFAAFTTVTSVIYGLTNSISRGVQAFIDYDKELVRLQQVTGQSANGLANLQAQISTLATTLGVSSKELTTVAVTLAQAGLSASDTEKSLRALALSSLAPSFDDMNETVEGSIALMRQFGIDAAQLESALGSINSVAAKFAVEASDIITAIQRTGSVFATASKGVSEGTDALNEFIAVFTSVRATTRESAETIATGLRTIFTRIQRSSTVDALRAFGVNLTDAEGKFVGAYKAVELLSQGLNKLDPRSLDFSKIVEELGGFRQIGKVIPLIQQFAIAQDALKVAQRGQGSLAADAATAQLSLANQIAKVREEFFSLFREIGASQGFQTLVRGALALTSGLIKLTGALKGVLPALAIITAFKGAKALTEFASGFSGGLKKGPDNKSSTAPLFHKGGRVYRFAKGGSVPGSGSGDTVPAMLEPGEFVIRKKAVEAIGADKLQKMNRYDSGGTVYKESKLAQLPTGRKKIKWGATIQGEDEVGVSIVPKPIELTQNDFPNLLNIIQDTYKNNINQYQRFRAKEKMPSFDGKTPDSVFPAKDIDLSTLELPLPRPPANWAKGNAFEQWLDQKFKISNKKPISKNASFSKIVKDHFAPLDFESGDAKFEQNATAYFSKNKTAIKPLEILSKRVRDKQDTLPWTKNIDQFTQKNKSALPDTEIYYPEDPQNTKKAFDTFYEQEFNKTILANAQNLKIPLTDIIKAQGLENIQAANSGGLIKKFMVGGKALGARRRLRDLDAKELDQLSTSDLIMYAKAQALDIFSSGGSGMAVGNEFIEVPAERITAELDKDLVTHMGKRGFWKEIVAPFGQSIQPKPSGPSPKQLAKIGKEEALAAQMSKYSDEVAARSQQLSSITSGSPIDRYLLSTLTDPMLSDYRTVRGGGILSNSKGEKIPFHYTRLRRAINKALDAYDDFDYSAGNIDKLVGSIARRFMDGGAVTKEDAASASRATILSVLKDRPGGIDTTARNVGVSASDIYTLLGKRNPDQATKALQDAIRHEYMITANRQRGAARASLTKASNKGLEFAAVGMLGQPFKSGLYEAIGSKGPRQVKIISSVMDSKLASELDDMYLRGADELSSRGASKAMTSRIVSQLKEGRLLNLDFDRTLVRGADDILSDPSTPLFAEFGDRTKVAEALDRAQFTELGQTLADLVELEPDLLSRMRVITARPASTLDILRKWLADKGLPISRFEGFGAPGISASEIADLKAAVLEPGSLFVDDDPRNIAAASSRSADNIETYQYGASTRSRNINTDSSIQGGLFEKMIQDLGGPGAQKGFGLDFPKGLQSAAKYFGISPDIPTDAKRTINGASIVTDNINTYLKAMGFAKGGKATLYHGSNTGVNDSVLESFKQQGARSDIAKGYGQGAGFYLYTEKDKAINQAKMRVNGGSGFTVAQGDTSGRPMVLSFEELLTPENYDLDYELQKGLVVKWIYENFDKAKSISESEESPVKLLNRIDKDRTKNIGSVGIRVQEQDQKMISDTGEEYMVRGGSRKTIYAGTEGDIREGELIGKLMNRLQANDPLIVHAFENQLFERPLGLALKYVGSAPLKPVNIEKFADGGFLGDGVPALVSNGEAYVPPDIAQKIGYDQLYKMNQADKNGMHTYSTGGISVFKGPGTGTSDSIRTNLPVGSFILREKATKALGLNRGGSVGVVRSFAGGGAVDFFAQLNKILNRLDTRPQNINRSTIGVDDQTIGSVRSLIEALNKLGISASNTASILNSGGETTYKILEKAMAKDIERLKLAGAGIDQIVAAEQTLADIRKKRDKDIDLRKNLEGMFEKRGSSAKPILMGSTIGNLQSGSGASQQAIELQAQMIYNSKIEKMRNAGRDITEDKRKEIMSSSYLTAASRVSGIKQSAFRSYGIEGEDIQKYIAESMKNRKILSDMDKQLVALRMEEYDLHKTVRGKAVASASEAERLAQEEISERRKIINDLAKQRGESGVGAGGFFDIENSPLLNMFKERYVAEGSTPSLGGLKAQAFTDLALAIGATTAAASDLSKLFYDMSSESGQKAAAAQSAAISQAGTTLSAGLATAAQALTIPVAGPWIAGAIALGTAAYAAADYIYDFNGAQQDAILEVERQLSDKKLKNALDSLVKTFKDYENNLTNVGLRQQLESQLNVASSESVKRNSLETQEAISAKANTRSWLGWAFGEKTPTMDVQDIGSFASQRAEANAQQYDNIMRLIDIDINKGASIETISQNETFQLGFAATDFKTLNDIIKQEVSLKRSLTEAEKKAIAAKNLENDLSIQARIKTKAMNDAFEAANRAGRKLSDTFAKLFEAIDNSINRIKYESEQRQQAIDGFSKGLMGQAEIQEISLPEINILENRTAYGADQVQDAINTATMMLPPDKREDIKNAAMLESTVGPDIKAAIDSVLGDNKNLPLNEAADLARTTVENIIDKSGLSEDKKALIKDKARTNIDKIEKNIEENPGSDPIARFVEEVTQVGGAIGDLGKQSIDTLVKALKLQQDSVNNLTRNINEAAKSALEAARTFRKADDIRYKGQMDLRELTTGFGESYDEARARTMRRVSDLSGGLTDPTDIRKNIELLSRQFEDEQALYKKDIVSSDPNIRQDAIDRFKEFNVKLNNSREALDMLADSAELVEKAFNELKNIDSLQKGRQNFVDQLITNTPDEADKLNKALMRLQNNIMGGLNLPNNQRDARKAFNETLRQTGSVREATRAGNTVLANQRKETLDLMNNPGWKAAQELQIRNMYANGMGQPGVSADQAVADYFKRQQFQVTKQMAIESGMINNPLVQQSLAAIANPDADPVRAKAAEKYLEAVGLRAKATEEQARLHLIDSNERLIKSIDTLTSVMISLSKGEGLPDIAQNFNDRGEPFVDISRVSYVKAAKGGIIYAKQGRLINFQPKGTDTVPAMLTPGEFVINAQSTKENLPLLTAINNGANIVSSPGMRSGGVVYLKNGGQPDKPRTRQDLENTLEKEKAESDNIARTVKVRTAAYNAPDSKERIEDENTGRSIIDEDVTANIGYQIQGDGPDQFNDPTYIRRQAEYAARRRAEMTADMNTGRVGDAWEKLTDEQKQKLVDAEISGVNSVIRSYQEKPWTNDESWDKVQKALEARIDQSSSIRAKREEYITPAERARLGQISINTEQGFAVQANMGDVSATTDRSLLNDLDLVENRNNSTNAGRIASNAVNNALRAAGIPEEALRFGPGSRWAFVKDGVNWTERMATEKAKPDFEARAQAERAVILERERKLAEDRLRAANVAWSIPQENKPSMTPERYQELTAQYNAMVPQISPEMVRTARNPLEALSKARAQKSRADAWLREQLTGTVTANPLSAGVPTEQQESVAVEGETPSSLPPQPATPIPPVSSSPRPDVVPSVPMPPVVLSPQPAAPVDILNEARNRAREAQDDLNNRITGRLASIQSNTFDPGKGTEQEQKIARSRNQTVKEYKYDLQQSKLNKLSEGARNREISRLRSLNKLLSPSPLQAAMERNYHIQTTLAKAENQRRLEDLIKAGGPEAEAEFARNQTKAAKANKTSADLSQMIVDMSAQNLDLESIRSIAQGKSPSTKASESATLPSTLDPNEKIRYEQLSMLRTTGSLSSADQQEWRKLHGKRELNLTERTISDRNEYLSIMGKDPTTMDAEDLDRYVRLRYQQLRVDKVITQDFDAYRQEKMDEIKWQKLRKSSITTVDQFSDLADTTQRVDARGAAQRQINKEKIKEGKPLTVTERVRGRKPPRDLADLGAMFAKQYFPGSRFDPEMGKWVDDEILPGEKSPRVSYNQYPRGASDEAENAIRAYERREIEKHRAEETYRKEFEFARRGAAIDPQALKSESEAKTASIVQKATRANQAASPTSSTGPNVAKGLVGAYIRQQTREEARAQADLQAQQEVATIVEKNIPSLTFDTPSLSESIDITTMPGRLAYDYATNTLSLDGRSVGQVSEGAWHKINETVNNRMRELASKGLLPEDIKRKQREQEHETAMRAMRDEFARKEARRKADEAAQDARIAADRARRDQELEDLSLRNAARAKQRQEAEDAQRAAAAAAAAAAADQARRDSYWINSDNSIVAGLGYLGGLGEVGGRAVRGALYAGIGNLADAASGIIGNNTDVTKYDERIKRNRSRQAEMGVLADQRLDPGARKLANDYELARGNAQMDAEAARMTTSSRDAFRSVVQEGRDAGYADLASIPTLILDPTNYTESAVGSYIDRQTEKLKEMGLEGSAIANNLAGYTGAIASDAIVSLAVGGADLGTLGKVTGITKLRGGLARVLSTPGTPTSLLMEAGSAVKSKALNKIKSGFDWRWANDTVRNPYGLPRGQTWSQLETLRDGYEKLPSAMDTDLTSVARNTSDSLVDPLRSNAASAVNTLAGETQWRQYLDDIAKPSRELAEKSEATLSNQYPNRWKRGYADSTMPRASTRPSVAGKKGPSDAAAKAKADAGKAARNAEAQKTRAKRTSTTVAPKSVNYGRRVFGQKPGEEFIYRGSYGSSIEEGFDLTKMGSTGSVYGSGVYGGFDLKKSGQGRALAKRYKEQYLLKFIRENPGMSADQIAANFKGGTYQLRLKNPELFVDAHAAFKGTREQDTINKLLQQSGINLSTVPDAATPIQAYNAISKQYRKQLARLPENKQLSVQQLNSIAKAKTSEAFAREGIPGMVAYRNPTRFRDGDGSGVVSIFDKDAFEIVSKTGIDPKEAKRLIRASKGAKGFASGGVIYANNGALAGLSQGTDTVHAMLTPGEFVVNKESAQKYMPVLQAINNGHNRMSDIMTYMANGGIVAPKYYNQAGMVSPVRGGVSNNVPSMDTGVSNTVNAVKNIFSQFNNLMSKGIEQYNQMMQNNVDAINSASQNINNAAGTMLQSANVYNEAANVMPNQLTAHVNTNNVVNHTGLDGIKGDMEKNIYNNTNKQGRIIAQNAVNSFDRNTLDGGANTGKNNTPMGAQYGNV